MEYKFFRPSPPILKGGLERLMMGSVTERVLHATKLPMLIVRPQRTAAYGS